MKRCYIAIDLKSFYVSVECVERGLDPLRASLVVADESRTEKTICLAVSPALKARGVSGRARLFEVLERVPRNEFIAAPPRMSLYIDYSTRVYNVYLKYIAPEDIHVYSIDEVFMDVTNYLPTYKMTPHQLAMHMIHDVLRTTGITATAGIGTNLYLSKVAMDIVAKHIPADEDGVRIASLDEETYRQTLWDHKPLTDFWRVGHGIANRLARFGIDTMGKIAKKSLEDEDLLYDLFGINAELLIDHAWGQEPVTMELIKAYRPETNSLSSGQVLSRPYSFQMGRTVIKEMADNLSLELVDKRLVCNQLVLTVSYDRECLTRPEIRDHYHGEISSDYYGRPVPAHSHGTINLGELSSSSRLITSKVLELYDEIVNPLLLIRRLNITTCHVVTEEQMIHDRLQLIEGDLFTDYETLAKQKQEKKCQTQKERKIQEALLAIKHRFGKNAILRGTSYAEEATQKERNNQIGGHKA